MANIELIATTLLGMESLVSREIKSLGYNNVKVENGRVIFKGDEQALCRGNLWLRTAERLLLKIGEFTALTFDELFEGTKSLPWHKWIPENAAFPVKGYSLKSKLFSVPDCQAIIKKAVVEKLKTRYKKQWFEENGPLYPIRFSIMKDRVTLMLDTSGESLHKRGYRQVSNEAPLRETLAAAMIMLSDWRYDRPLIDPFCGSGTIPIEAALIGTNTAPGINRDFISKSWPNIPKKLWDNAHNEAHDMIKNNIDLNILGSDINSKAIKLSQDNAIKSGMDKHTMFKQCALKDFSTNDKYGCIICNPPYGERIGKLDEVEKLYIEMGNIFKKLDTWSFYVLTSHEDFERLFGKKANKNRKLYNGMIKCYYYQFFGPRPPRKKTT
ncbi:MAG TPA: class I SAM-dependent RNA methyltransferase [Thermoanaerobacterales bacterium]|nr:class I SAM-dependent RNA methyltransferase [Thermoanaerobacterales bacterium]